METVSLTIDGRLVTVEKGKSVLQAAIESGFPVPYYCFHPGLTVDGSCRVCIVKVEKMPKLQTSCSTMCADGMVVTTDDPETREARAGVLEFLLVNHPLDCPVCDKGGECPLQDFAYSFGPAGSRMDFPRRTFDGEGVKADVDFGPTLMLNRNRCILCTRCVRFMREIDGDAQINVVDRGSGSEIATFRERGVHSLLSGNLMDVCPVGAITTKEYRFRSRPWDNPAVVDTICTRCARGCNTSAWLKAKPEWAKGSRLIRMTPRLNPDVNGFWMCDIGRFDYHWVEGGTRLSRPMHRVGDALVPLAWPEAEARLGDALRGAATEDAASIRFLVSAHAATEELFVLHELLEAVPGSPGAAAAAVAWTLSEKEQPANTRFAIPRTDAPNVNGAQDAGFAVGQGNGHPADLSGLRTDMEAGRVRVLYVVDPGPEGSLGDVSWVVQAREEGRLQLLIVQGVVWTDVARAADFVLPGAAWVEKDAIYTNEQGTVQGASRAVMPPGESREDWAILVAVGRLLGVDLDYASADDVRKAISGALPAYTAAANVAFVRPVSARNWLQASNPSERWKWDFLYQDLPPVKGHNVQMDGTMTATPYISLRPVG
jgi:NADH-quinone oxidoreductase subunit G